VTSLAVKTKRTKTVRALATEAEEEEAQQVSSRRLAGLGVSKPAHLHHNASALDSWTFKGVANFTRDPDAIQSFLGGFVVELSNNAGATLDTVAFAANECNSQQKGRRIMCKHAGGPSGLSFTQVTTRKSKGASPVWALSGRFVKQDIVGDIAAKPLFVTLYGDIAYVDRYETKGSGHQMAGGRKTELLPSTHPTHILSVPNCKVARSGLTVSCKDTAAKLK
jgi:hypothetical protein